MNKKEATGQKISGTPTTEELNRGLSEIESATLEEEFARRELGLPSEPPTGKVFKRKPNKPEINQGIDIPADKNRQKRVQKFGPASREIRTEDQVHENIKLWEAEDLFHEFENGEVAIIQNKAKFSNRFLDYLISASRRFEYTPGFKIGDISTVEATGIESDRIRIVVKNDRAMLFVLYFDVEAPFDLKRISSAAGSTTF